MCAGTLMLHCACNPAGWRWGTAADQQLKTSQWATKTKATRKVDKCDYTTGTGRDIASDSGDTFRLTRCCAACPA